MIAGGGAHSASGRTVTIGENRMVGGDGRFARIGGPARYSISLQN